MSLEKHWYRYTYLHALLLPISWLFGLLVAIRRVFYRMGLFSSTKLPVATIVVGNVSVGGTGKTPCTLALAQLLIQHGRHPLIVSRGYGGNALQPQRVELDSNTQQVGDEPLLMARRDLCPVYIGRDRVAAAQLALAQHPECDVVLCDDGLQHYRLQRDIEVAVVDAARGLGNRCLLPAGPLREPASRLNSVDVVVMNGGANMSLQGELFYQLQNPQHTVSADFFAHAKNHAIAGIGHPQRFFDSLAKLGIHSVNHAFADHHPYVAQDLNFSACDYILMTEKDAVKCAAFADERCWVLRVDAQLSPEIINLILRKITSYGCQTA